MGSDRERLAIRTIVVTTRAAVRSHRNGEKADLARQSALRGLALLDQFDGHAEWIADARRQLEALAAGPLTPVGPGTGEADAAASAPETSSEER